MNNLPLIANLVQNGQPKFGVFQSVGRLNYLDYHSFLLSQKAVPNWLKYLKVNQFAFIYINHPPYQIGIAIASIKLASTAFAYVYNQNTRHMDVVEAKNPFTINITLQGDHQTGRLAFHNKKISVTLDIEPNQLQLTVETKPFSLNATLQRNNQPLCVCVPTGRRGWTFTQKEPLDGVTGKLTFNQHHHSTLEFNQHTLAQLDYSLGYMRHVTNWFWACIHSPVHHNGQTMNFALNLASGVNETGICENACWLDGKIYHLPPVLFVRPEGEDTQSSQSEWHITHQPLGWSTVTLDLTFTPLTPYARTENFGVVMNKFEQWVGVYAGVIEVAGQRIELVNIMGLAEDHVAKW